MNIDPGLLDRAADAEELAAVTAEAKLRRLRAKLGVVAFLGATIILLMVLPARGRFHAIRDLHCHYVEIRWENAPEIPGNRWQSCEWRYGCR